MKFSIIITASPESNLSYTALNYTKHLILNNHQILIIFFQGDGVYHALKKNDKSSAFWQNWLETMSQNNIKLVCCSSANIKRGISLNQDSPIISSGLGELIISIKESDKVLKF